MTCLIPVVHQASENEKSLAQKENILVPDNWTARFLSPGFISIFNRGATGFHRWIKLSELNFFIRKTFL